MEPRVWGMVLGGIAGVLVLFLVVVFSVGDRLFPGKHVYTEIEIAAPPEAVWAVLADNTNYPAWNPYHVQVEGEMVVGAKLAVHIHKPNGEQAMVEPHLLRLVPNRELTWGGGVHGLFYGEHVFLLEEVPLEEVASTNQTDMPTRHTRLIHKESFTGLAVMFVPLEAIDEGYALMNEALKQTIETNH